MKDKLDLPYESEVWPNIPESDRKKILTLKRFVDEYEKDLTRPWEASVRYTRPEDKREAEKMLKQYRTQLFRLQSNYGLIDEAKNYVRMRYGLRVLNKIKQST